MLIALICLTLISVIAVSLLRCALAQTNQTQAQQRRLQAVWLAESAGGRAAARLAVDPDYQGETWKPMPLGYAPKAMNASVTITVRPIGGKPDWRMIEVLTIHPVDRRFRSRIRKTFRVRLPQKAGDKS